MLSILVLLAATPQASMPVPTTASSVTVVTIPPEAAAPLRIDGAPMPVLGDSSPLCEMRTTQANDISRPGDLMWRHGDQAVGLYRLLGRRIDGCPAPILVNERVPGSNALGRELGRGTAPAPTPVIVRRP